MKTAEDLGLYVLLRPGPYICAERNGGGLPFWLYQLHPDIKLRSSDPNFLKHVDQWWDVLLPRIKPHLYINGGNVIMVQLENEYGSYGLQTKDCDLEYMSHLRDLAKHYLGPDVVLYTTDGDADNYLRCGRVPGAYATVDFGPGTNITKAFQVMRHFEPHGPLVNSEFFPGWLDYWGQPHHTVASTSSSDDLDKILSTGASVNVYMAHGGTSFGFGNGANTPPFSIEPTSYDYDAPISEAGDLTPKYFAFKRVIAKHLPKRKRAAISDGISITKTAPLDNNATSPKGNYGKVKLKYVSTFFEAEGILLKQAAASARYPLTFEQIGQSDGFVYYETKISSLFSDPAKLQVSKEGIHDRAYVFVNREPRGILSRAEGIFSMPLSTNVGDTIQILVENQGRIGYGPFAKDFKGLVNNVTLNGKILEHWNIFSMPLNDTNLLIKYATTSLEVMASNPRAAQKVGENFEAARGQAGFWYGEFQVPCQDPKSLDTFLDFPGGWTKGVAFVNQVNLGRYWPRVGPQLRLYVPGVYLNPPCTKNTLILFEQENPGCENMTDCYVKLVDTPNINGPTPIKNNGNMLNHSYQLFKRP